MTEALILKKERVDVWSEILHVTIWKSNNTRRWSRKFLLSFNLESLFPRKNTSNSNSNYLCAKSVYKHLLREKQYSSATHDGRNAILIRIRNHEKRDHEIFELVFCKRVDGREAKTRKFNSQRKSHFPFPRRTGKLARVVRVAARKFSCKSK